MEMRSRTPRTCFGLFAFAFALAAAPACAQPGLGWYLAVDNDYFNFWQCPDCRPDFGYTHGAEIAFHSPRVPRLLQRLAPRSLVASDGTSTPRMVVSLRQEIYTPWEVVGGRPYAGWLEVGVGIRNETPRRLRSGRIHVGVTGPPSLADRTQRWIHRAFGFSRSWDWSHQLPFEPGAAIEYEDARLFGLGSRDGLRVAAGPWYRGRLGTVVTDLSAGGQAVLGLRPAAPWKQSDATPSHPALYLIAGARLDAVVRNEFLDGTLFRPSVGVDKRTFVPEVEGGVALQLHRARLEWRATRRGEEFRGQPGAHTYSTIAISWLPGPPR